MQFKKGSFEVGGIIYPVAIKVSLHICVVQCYIVVYSVYSCLNNELTLMSFIV